MEFIRIMISYDDDDDKILYDFCTLIMIYVLLMMNKVFNLFRIKQSTRDNIIICKISLLNR